MAAEMLDLHVSSVLITGGNGTLGRSIVGLLQKTFPSVKLIRLLDNNPDGKDYFKVFMTRESTVSSSIKIEYEVGDIQDRFALQKVLQGIQCVIHTAGIVDVSMFPDASLMWSVNCRGTQNLMNESLEANVRYFIYTSSVNAIMGSKGRTDLEENDCSKPDSWYWKTYGETKWFAEQLVLQADNIPLPNNQTIRTLCLRPTMFYGENDHINVSKLLQVARGFGGRLARIGTAEDMTVQQTYVGNVAWAHVMALKALTERPDECAGRAYFVTDNTPVMNPSLFAEPFLEDNGMKLTSYSIPFKLVYFLSVFFLFVVNLIRRFLPEWRPNESRDVSMMQLLFPTMKYTFSRKAAEERLKYSPRFTFEESLKRSRAYYQNKF